MVKVCGKCRISLPLGSFHKAKKEKDGHQSWCIQCRKFWKRGERLSYMKERYHTQKDQYLDSTYKRRYGIDLEEYNTRLNAQQNGCGICGLQCSSGRRLAVDHDHQTGQVRGLLCGNCNKGLGVFQDSPSLLKKAIEYLNESK